jgi:hypothetical protein
MIDSLFGFIYTNSLRNYEQLTYSQFHKYRMSLIEKHVTFTASSDPETGSTRRAADGSSFYLELLEPLVIPRNAVTPILTVESASIWWTTPNIITGVNDTMTVNGLDASDVPTVYNITIQEGLYSLREYDAIVQRELLHAGAKPNMFSIVGNDNTQRVDIIFNFTAVSLVVPAALGVLLGFTTLTIGNVPVAPDSVTGDTTARIPPLDFYLIQCSLVDNGILMGNRLSSIAAQVYVDQPAGFQIQYNPNRPTELACSNLKGAPTTEVRFGLLNERLQSVSTGGQEWSVRMKITWKELV